MEPTNQPHKRPKPSIPEHELLARIGGGSFGEVWLARNRLGTHRAVKVVYRDRFESDRAWEREMKGLRQFEPISRTHDGLVDILQVGQNEAEDWVYCVMELADATEQQAGKWESEKVGVDAACPSSPAHSLTFSPASYSPRTLASDLRRHGRLPAAECLQLGLALADALAHLHRNGLLHRDVKPSNIVFVDGVPKLADIGLVAAVREAGSFVGTRGFMPPEGHQDGRGDVFSLGKVLYECAWGRDRLDFPEVPTDAAEWAEHPQLVELNEVILKATEPLPERRYASAAEMRDDLALLQQGQSVRRLRRLEKYWRRTTQIATASVILASLAFAGFFFQQRQSRRLQILADENRDHLVQLRVSNGVRLMEEGDVAVSALWFHEALNTVAGEPGHEWVHRRRLGAVLERSPRLLAVGTHRGRVRAARFSPDGRVFATAGVDGLVQTWDALTGAATGPAMQHGTVVHDLQFSLDGHWIATVAEDDTVRVWNAASGSLRFNPLRHGAYVNSARFSRDGRWLVTASEDGIARTWDAATGKSSGMEFSHKGPVNDAEFSPDGSLIATASDDDTARIWDFRSGISIGAPLAHRHDVRSVRFSPDGKYVATASKDGAARVWSAATGDPATAPLEHMVPLWTAEFSPDGRTVLAAGGDGDNGGTARLWDVRTGEPRSPPLRHENTIRNAAFSPDGRWTVTASHDRTAKLWNAGTGAQVGGPFRHTHMVKWVSFSPDGKRLVLAGENEMWKLWDLAGALQHAAPSREVLPFQIAKFSPDGRTILGITTNQTAVLCDAATRRVQFTLGEHADKVVSISFSRNGQRVLTVSRDGSVRVWNTANGIMACPPLKHGLVAKDFAEAEFSRDGQLMASVSTHDGDRMVKLWDLAGGGTCRLELEHTYPPKTLAFSPDGSMLLTGSGEGVSGKNGEARLWSTHTGALHAIMPHSGSVHIVRWSPDGRCFVTICHDSSQEQKSARLWNASTKVATVLPSDKMRFTRVTFSPDSHWLATGADDGEVRIWDTTTGIPLSKPFGHRRTCWTLGFSPDGRQLASASLDPFVRIWDPLTGEPLGPALVHGASIRTVSFDPAGDAILVSGGDLTTLWRFRVPARPVKELQMLAQLASGCRLDEITGVMPLTASEMIFLLRQTRP